MTLSRISDLRLNLIADHFGPHPVANLQAALGAPALANIPFVPNSPTGGSFGGPGPSHGGAGGPAASMDDGDGVGPHFPLPIFGGADDGIVGHGVKRVGADGGLGGHPSVSIKGHGLGGGPDGKDDPDGTDGTGGTDGTDDPTPPPTDTDPDFKLPPVTLDLPPEKPATLGIPTLTIDITRPDTEPHGAGPNIYGTDIPPGTPNFVGGTSPSGSRDTTPKAGGVAGWIGQHLSYDGGVKGGAIIIRNQPPLPSDPDPSGTAPRTAPVTPPPPDPPKAGDGKPRF